MKKALISGITTARTAFATSTAMGVDVMPAGYVPRPPADTRRRRGSASTSCDIAQHFRLPSRGRSNRKPPETVDPDTGNITYFSDGCKSNRMRGVSKVRNQTCGWEPLAASRSGSVSDSDQGSDGYA